MNAQPLEVILARAHKEQRCIRICMDSGIVYQGLHVAPPSSVIAGP